MVRRLKSDLRETGFEFPKRRIVEIKIDDLPPDAPELGLSELVDNYRKELLDNYRKARESRTRTL